MQGRKEQVDCISMIGILVTMAKEGRRDMDIDDIYRTAVADDITTLKRLISQNVIDLNTYYHTKNDLDEYITYNILYAIIFHVAETRKYEALDCLIDAGVNLECLIEGYRNGEYFSETLLGWAVADKGDFAIAEHLLKKGANPNVCNVYSSQNGRQRRVPLIYFPISQNNGRMLDLFLKHGADANAHRTVWVNEAFSEDLPVIYDALCEKKSESMVKALLLKGASLDTYMVWNNSGDSVVAFREYLSGVYPELLEMAKKISWSIRGMSGIKK